ncbi:glycine-rich domain-containing protein [Achromobacter spanius]|uniref:glycine-rich domain-containing protein n=1 Tax=Achromobacter spanius TaxID=217203 RepID=UPI000B2864F1|nr:hypothetical protein [Achromobacter spanius]
MATRIYKTPFAATGDKEALAAADQPDGKVSLQAGWTPDYELPNDNANYRPVGRSEMNGILNEVTESLGEIQLNGFAKWQEVDGGWPLGASAFHNGVVYQSTSDNNTSTPGEVGANWVKSQAGRLLNVRLFSTPGSSTYTPTTGTKAVRVRVVGGGGGGGGISGAAAGAWTAASGGAAGAYCESFLTSSFAGQTVTVGNGGAGAPAGANEGSAGGTSSFGAIMSATGGGGGLGNAASTGVTSIGGGAGGDATGGQINARGNGGGTAIVTASSNYQSGIGAGSVFGGGANSRRSGNQGAGINGVGPGSGGSGAAAGSGLAGNFAGGSGAVGIVIIEEYS